MSSAAYRKEPGVAPNSTVETFAALRLEIDSWRWQGVPFFIRAGKSLPVTCTEVTVRLRRAPRIFPSCPGVPNHFRFRISPEMTLALGTTVMDMEDKEIGQQVELLASHRPGAEEMDAYERVLGDAMTGDRTLFARQDYVEEAWRIVDPVLKKGTPVYEYEPGTWGPREVDPNVAPLAAGRTRLSHSSRECGDEDRSARRCRYGRHAGGRVHRQGSPRRRRCAQVLRDGRHQRHAGRHVFARLDVALVDLRCHRGVDHHLVDDRLHGLDVGDGLADIRLGDLMLLYSR
jgi:hypothetical protein